MGLYTTAMNMQAKPVIQSFPIFIYAKSVHFFCFIILRITVESHCKHMYEFRSIWYVPKVKWMAAHVILA